MTNSLFEEYRAQIATMQSDYRLEDRTDNKRRLSAFFIALESAKEALDAIIDNWDSPKICENCGNEFTTNLCLQVWCNSCMSERQKEIELEALEEADASLIGHVNRRL